MTDLPDWRELATRLIQPLESCQLKAYHGAADRPGLYTCGWGSTGPDITASTVWTQQQADDRFAFDLARIGAGVDTCVKVALTAAQKAALVSFAYNLGLASLERSTLLTFVNDGNFAAAALQFPCWNHSCGVVVDGLTRRRLAEAQEFKS